MYTQHDKFSNKQILGILDMLIRELLQSLVSCTENFFLI